MAIAFHCPKCSVAITVPDSASGKRGTCPSCQARVIVPAIEVPGITGADPAAAPPTHPVPADINRPGAVPGPAPVAADAAPPWFAGASPASPALSETPAHFSPFPEPTEPPSTPVSGGVLPAVPDMQAPQSTIAARTRRRQKTKWSGKVLGLLCAAVLTAGVGWLYTNVGPDLEKTREAHIAAGTTLEPRVIANSQIHVPDDVRRSVLIRLEENSERLRSQLIETEFSGLSNGLEVKLLPGTQATLFRLPIDSDLREWYDDHFAELQQPHLALLEQSVEKFITAWDVAIRNQTHVEDFQSYRNSVGLTALVGALGYHLSGIVNNEQYPCVYEDRRAIYFLLPRGTKRFRVIGSRIDDRPSLFPGSFDVLVRPARTEKAEPAVPADSTEVPETPEPEMDSPAR